MSTPEHVLRWLDVMGYDGGIPENLENICNPHTFHIWEMLCINAQSRENVKYMKNNIIISRLRTSGSLQNAEQFVYPCKEIELYEHCLKLEGKKSSLKKSVCEAKEKFENPLRENNVSYMVNARLKQQVKENEEKAFIFHKKSKMLHHDIQRVEEMITFIKTSTPVEMKDNETVEITETLQKCAEKLQKICLELPKKNTSSSISSLNLSRSVKKNEKSKTGPKKKNRESLGLLPEDFLQNESSGDSFLSTSQDSILYKSQIFDDMKSKDLLAVAENDSFIYPILNNKHVIEIIKNLLTTKNRQLILQSFEELNKDLLSNLKKNALQFNQNLINKTSLGQVDQTQLYLNHVQIELKRKNLQPNLKKLRKLFSTQKTNFLSVFNKNGDSNELKKMFELQLEEVELEAAINSWNEELYKHSSINETDNPLSLLMDRIKQIHQKTGTQIKTVEDTIENTYAILQHIKDTRTTTFGNVDRMGALIIDISWADALNEPVFSSEIETFQQFPLEYNRTLGYGMSAIKVRDVYTNTIPTDVRLDESELQMVSRIIDVASSPSEDIILRLLQSKVKLKALKSIQNDPLVFDSKSEFEFQEDYIRETVAELRNILDSKPVRSVLASPLAMTNVMELWKDMPWRDYISDKRLVDGQNYMFYENKLKLV